MTDQLFVYGTLKKHMVRKKALGHDVTGEKATTPHYTEICVADNTGRWPTMWASPFDEVAGIVLPLKDGDLPKLDDWEDHYKRIEISTTKGPAWTYILKRQTA